MATYKFDTMSQSDATGFTSSDTLIFTDDAAAPGNVVVTEGTTTTTLTFGTKSLIFAQASLAEADITFSSAFEAGKDSQLVLGTSGADDVDTNFGSDGSVGYGLKGDDTVDATGGTGADYLFGGLGNDTLLGGAGNDHLYGLDLTGDGTADGADSIDGGAGNDYIQGNGGNDTLIGGTENDRINGGGGDDSITGNAGLDVINGNKGNDVIDGGAGNDEVRGGQGDDSVSGGADNDLVLGDLGNDTVVGGTGIDLLTGGAGNDVFVFAAGDADLAATSGALKGLVDTITDMASGDKIDIDTTLTDIHFQSSGVTFSTYTAALTHAQGLYDTDGNDNSIVYAMQVGADTYLFYDTDAAGTDLDSAILLQGIDAKTFFDADAPNGRFLNA